MYPVYLLTTSIKFEHNPKSFGYLFIVECKTKIEGIQINDWSKTVCLRFLKQN